MKKLIYFIFAAIITVSMFFANASASAEDVFRVVIKEVAENKIVFHVNEKISGGFKPFNSSFGVFDGFVIDIFNVEGVETIVFEQHSLAVFKGLAFSSAEMEEKIIDLLYKKYGNERKIEVIEERK